MHAGLKSHVDGGSCRAPSCLLERDRLGVGPAAICCRAAADDASALRGDHAPNIGIRRASAARRFSEPQRFLHEALIPFGYIPNCFSSFWNCRCRSFSAACL